MSIAPIKVLLIEDSEADAELVKAYLGAQKTYELIHRPTLGQALEQLAQGDVDVVLLDLGLPDSAGIGAIGRIRAAQPGLPVVVLTGLEDSAIGLAAIKQGAQDFVSKVDLDEDRLARAIRFSLERSRMQTELARLNEALFSVNDRLNDSNDELRRATRAKTQFLAHMSHELRTPLNGILGMMSLLRTTPLDETQSGYAETVFSSAQAMRAVLSNVLDLSRIEADSIELEETVFSVREVVADVCELWAPQAKGKDVALSEVVAPDVSKYSRGDRGRLLQVLTNLTNNALKFTARGEVTVRVSCGERETSDGETSGGIRFAVADTGVGIDPSEQERIFAAFEQTDAGRAREHDGAGLGLHICRLLVKKMGGRLEVRSAVGQGSTFSFTLPLPDASAEAPDVSAPLNVNAVGARLRALQGVQQVTALLVEDEPVNQLVATSLLEKLGLTVTLAVNGRQAVEKAPAGFSIILMDYQMPGMNGLEATAELRRLGVQTPIVALTGQAVRGDRERCLAAGMDGYLAKPIALEDLARVLDQILVVGSSAGECSTAQDD